MAKLYAKRPHRRAFLQVGLPMLAGGLGNNFAHGVEADRRSALKDHSVLMIFLHGGPSQYEFWDPKPDAPSDIRTVTGHLPTRLAGVRFGSHFPKLAQRADRFCVVRSYVPGDGNHDLKPLVSQHSLMGSLGAAYNSIAGPQNPVSALPSSLHLMPVAVGEKRVPPPDFGLAELQTATGPFARSNSPFIPGGTGPALANMTLSMPGDRWGDRSSLLKRLDENEARLDALSGTEGPRERAMRVLLANTGKAFQLNQEPERVIARYDTAGLVSEASIGTTLNNHNFYKEHVRSLGRLLLLGRRLIENGAGLVTVNTAFVWDMHADVNNAPVKTGMDWLAPPLDHALSVLLDDMEDRGLLERTLVVVCGEMGRTPKVNDKGGRDHWGDLGPLLLAGCGVPRGAVHGLSTRDGSRPASSPVTNQHLLGQIWSTLLDTQKLRLRADLGPAWTRMLGYPTIFT